jgi:threonine aldolase
MNDQIQQFASDNYSGICPEAWAAMEQANQGHQRAYGDDQWTARAADEFRQLFETDCEVFFAFNGTAANSLALSSLCQSYHSVICSETAHVETDECGAPEFFSNGSKLLTAHTEQGKLTPQAIREVALKRQDIHYPKPRVVTLTEPAHGRRTLCQRLCVSRLFAGRADLEGRRGRAVLWRHQERHGSGRGDPFLQSQAGRRL